MKKGNRDNRLIIASSEQSADLLWATRFFVPDPVIYLETHGRKILMVSELEYSRAKKEAHVHQVLSFAPSAPLPFLDSFLRKRKIKKILVLPSLGLREATFLKKKGYRLEIKSPFYPERALKTKEEKKAIVATLRATEAAIEEAIHVLKKSRIRQGKIFYQGKILTSEILRGVIHSHLIKAGCVGEQTIVAGGRGSANPHERGRGPLLPHQPIVLDVFPRSEESGYYGDITRTVVKGKASPLLRKMYRAVDAAQKRGITAIRNGADASKVHALVASTFESFGFKTTHKGKPEGFIHSTGHGLGLEIHESPRIGKRVTGRPFDGAQGRPAEILRAGHVVTVEPGLYYDHLGGIRLEDVVYVTRKGCEILTRLPHRFEIP